MYSFEALPGDVYVRDGEKVAEVARKVPVAARTIEEGASAPNDGRPSVLSPDEQLQVLEGSSAAITYSCTRSGAHPWPIS
jgi:hypothetical protein